MSSLLALLLSVLVATVLAHGPGAGEGGGGNALPPRHFELHNVREYHVTAPVALHSRPVASRHATLLAAAGPSPSGSTLTRPSGRVHEHLPSFSLTAFGEQLELELERNDQLLSPSFRFLVDTQERPFEFENCYYQGRVRGHPDSAVAVSTCNGGLDGMIVAGDGTHYVIQPASEFGSHATLDDLHSKAARGAPRLSLEQGLLGATRTDASDGDGSVLAPHVLFRLSDSITEAFTCGNDGHAVGGDQPPWGPLTSPSAHEHGPGQVVGLGVGADADADADRLGGRSPVRAQASGPYYIEMLVVNDLRQVTWVGGATNASILAFELVNGVQGLVSRLPSSIGQVTAVLVAVDNWSSTSQIPVDGAAPSITTPIASYLDAFVSWSYELRTRSVALGGVPHDNAHLLTGWNLDSTTAGRAGTGTMCQSRSAAISEDLSAGRGQSKVFTFQTMAHELGHNLGCNHDGAGNSCPVGGYLMAATMSPTFGLASTLQWSNCSVDSVRNLVQALDAGSNCLLNSPRARLGTTPVCGDFVLDAGEQCEPGLSPSLCESNCTFRPGVVCTGGPCCTASGRFRAAGEECQRTVRSCDLPDRCDGRSASCPTDDYRPDGTPCVAEGGLGAFCSRGVCVGLEAQCAAAGGSTPFVSGECGVNSCGALLCRLSPSAPCMEIRDGTGLTVLTATGTPCTPDGSKVCAASFRCENRTTVPVPCPAAGCGEFGDCAHSGRCVCHAGRAGARCENEQPCGVNCTALFRAPCVPGVSSVCGECLAGRATVLLDSGDPNAPCDLVVPGLDRAVDSVGTVPGSNPALAFDSNIYTKWVACFPSTSSLAPISCKNKPALNAHYSAPFEMLSYAIVSAGDRADADPRSWVVQGSKNRNGPWTDVDTRNNVIFYSRYKLVSFTVQNPGSYSSYRLSVDSVASADSSVVQVAELQYYSRTVDGSPVSPTSQSSSGTDGRTVAAAVIIPILIVGAALVGAWYYYRKRRAEDAAASWEWRPTEDDQEEEAEDEEEERGAEFANAPSLFVAQPAPVGSSLPAGWTEHVTDEGHVYYFSEITGDSVWERPI